LNVAISRAKQLLVVVGDIETMTGREGQDLYRPLLEHVEREGRVAGIGAVHAMDQAAGGRRRGDRRRQRPGAPVGGRRRRRGYGPRPVTPGAPVAANGAESPEGQAVTADAAAPPPRKFRRRRGRRRGGFGGSNGASPPVQSDGTAASAEGPHAPPPPADREPAVQAADRSA
jgi:hypothetical protein